MPRANRHHLPGYIWHLTHRGHDRRFQLRFARDRRAWVGWLYEARRRYGLCGLDYNVTSNHVHLLVHDQGHFEIAASMQLIAGPTGQRFKKYRTMCESSNHAPPTLYGIAAVRVCHVSMVRGETVAVGEGGACSREFHRRPNPDTALSIEMGPF